MLENNKVDKFDIYCIFVHTHIPKCTSTPHKIAFSLNKNLYSPHRRIPHTAAAKCTSPFLCLHHSWNRDLSCCDCGGWHGRWR